jgi:transposase
MIRKVKHSHSFKISCVEEVLKKHRSIRSVSKEKHVGESQLLNWVDLYRSKGRKGLLPRRNAYYTTEFKLSVLKNIKENGLSLRSAREQFDISSDSVIITWQKKYAHGGLLELKNKPRGRPTNMPFKRAKKKSDKPLTREEELLKENELLRAENALLKKLQALIQAEEKEKRKPLQN